MPRSTKVAFTSAFSAENSWSRVLFWLDPWPTVSEFCVFTVVDVIVMLDEPAVAGPVEISEPVTIRLAWMSLPAREARMLGDLISQGDVGYELLLDPTSPLIVGVFPVRPVQRA